MKIFITGAGGMLGTDLVRALAKNFAVAGAGRYPAGHLTIPYHVAHLAQPGEAERVILAEKPGFIFHTAAMTDVDGCEKNPEEAMQHNFETTKRVVEAANRAGACLIFFSTDYIFDGEKKAAYEETDPPHPINHYGESKLLAETYIRDKAAHFVIFRLSWLFGLYGKSFPRTILERAPATERFEVVSDQVGRPTYTRDLAGAFSTLLCEDPGIFAKTNGQTFHLGNSGTASWAEFAVFILQAAGHTEKPVLGILTRPGHRPAARPRNSVLSLAKTERMLGIRLRPWQEAVTEFVHEWKAGREAVPRHE